MLLEYSQAREFAAAKFPANNAFSLISIYLFTTVVIKNDLICTFNFPPLWVFYFCIDYFSTNVALLWG